MSRSGRKLTPEEAALWARVAKTVAPLEGKALPRHGDLAKHGGGESPLGAKRSAATEFPAKLLPTSTPLRQRSALPSLRAGEELGRAGLDSSWEKKFARGTVEADFTLDLHGASLDAAHGRLIHGLTQAKGMGVRVVLLVTGRARPGEAADRGQRRGAIRAKVIDWLAHSEHAGDIAAVRNAHRRHGGAGALYIVLKRRRG